MSESVQTSSTQEVSVSRTPFIGRQPELEQLAETLDNQANLLTIVGPPGAGKTRLAREYGRARSDRDETTLYFCDLSSAETTAELISIVADALGVSLQDDDAGTPPRDRVARALDGRDDVLVVLDNVEQMGDEADAVISTWSGDATETDLVVTSRERLGVAGEHCLQIGPLETDDAVELFFRRARMAGRDLERTDEMVDQVDELVERLDRLPLAIELAASRIRTLPPAELLGRLSDRFRLLRSRDDFENRRQQTLEDAIAWSWELLDDAEREVLGQCTVFQGGFSLDAAETVLAPDEDRWVVDIIEALVRKSLLLSDPPEAFQGHARFEIYESVRAFVRDALETDLEEVRARHADHYLEVGRTWAERLSGPEAEKWLSQMRLETANFRAAFDWFAGDAPGRAVELGLVLDQMLRVSGPLGMHRRVIERTVELARGSEEPASIARALLARARLAMLTGDLDRAHDDAREALAQLDEDDASRLAGRIRFALGEIVRQRGDVADGRDHLESALANARDRDDRALERSALAHLASCEIDLGRDEAAADRLDAFDRTPASDHLRRECRATQRAAYAHYFLGNYHEQRRLNERALSLARQLADRKLEGIALQGLGDSAFAAGEYEDAVDDYRDALELHRKLGNEHFEGVLKGNLATALHRLGRLEEASDGYHDSLDIHRRTGARPYLATVSFAYGTLLLERDELDRAARRLEESVEIYGEIDGKVEDLAATRLTHGFVSLARREESDAAGHFRRAADEFDEADADAWQTLAETCAAVADWCLGETDDESLASALDRAADARGDRDARAIADVVGAIPLADDDLREAENRLDRARTGRDDDRPLVERSLFGRAATVAVDRAVARDADRPEADPVTRSAQPDLLVGPEGKWFQTDEEVTDLRRRGSLRRILAELVDRHGSSPDGLEVFDMFDVGWPDQQIDPDNAQDRVYWAVRELRDAGLASLLQTTDEGYILDPSAEVVVSEEPNPEDGIG